jgi:catechol 2,3-dioxygenase-like lactoylglutathione lyase family enzyme
MKLTGLTPNLFTEDIDRATAFYRDVLGFSVTTTVPEAAPFVFVWLQRDAVSVFLNDLASARRESPALTGVAVGTSGVSMFIHVEGIGEIWESVRLRARVVMPIVDQWYGMTEFAVADPDGYLVTFAERRAASDEAAS